MQLRFVFALMLIACLGSSASAADLDTAKIDQLTGGKGALNRDEGVYKVSFPRTDVKVTVDGTPMPPFMGLTSWAAFKTGEKSQAQDGIAKATLRRTTKMPWGCEAGKELGINTWAAFYGADDHAFVDGDFAVVQGELQGVLKTLRKNGVNIVAIHSHMENENPRIIFLHYWGIGPAVELAKSVKEALDMTAKK